MKRLIAGSLVAGLLSLGLAIPAGADSTCYTGCTPSTPTPGISPQAPADAPVAPAAPANGLAFTGADIEEMALLGLAGIGIGTVLIRKRRLA